MECELRHLLQPNSAAGEPGQSPEPNEFVSAVCWRNDTNILLAANSKGYVKVSSYSSFLATVSTMHNIDHTGADIVLSNTQTVCAVLVSIMCICIKID